jgi:hypothetical protein
VLFEKVSCLTHSVLRRFRPPGALESSSLVLAGLLELALDQA